MTYYRSLLRERGIASTRQRALILRAMRERADHPDVEAVFATLRRELPSLSLDTVYRTLRLLVQEKLIQQLALPTHRFHFDGNADPHDHFLCTVCETVADIAAADGLDPLFRIPEAIRRHGEVHAVQRVFLGTCRSCTGGLAPVKVRTGQGTGGAGERGCGGRQRKRKPAVGKRAPRATTGER